MKNEIDNKMKSSSKYKEFEDFFKNHNCIIIYCNLYSHFDKII